MTVRRLLVPDVIAERRHDGEVLPRPGERDVEETTLLLYVLGISR